MGISTVQSRPSSSATRGRGCIGPFIIWGRIPAGRQRGEGVNYLCLAHTVKWGRSRKTQGNPCRSGKCWTGVCVWAVISVAHTHTNVSEINTLKLDFKPLSSSPLPGNTGRYHTLSPTHQQYDYPPGLLLLSTLFLGNWSFHPVRSSPPLSYHHTEPSRPSLCEYLYLLDSDSTLSAVIQFKLDAPLQEFAAGHWDTIQWPVRVKKVSVLL